MTDNSRWPEFSSPRQAAAEEADDDEEAGGEAGLEKRRLVRLLLMLLRPQWTDITQTRPGLYTLGK